MAAAATPPSGVSAKLVFDVRIGDTELVRREITIAAGGSTGWHYHDGPIVGRVVSGTLTHLDADCTAVIYRAGELIFEPSGAGHVHVGRNDAGSPLVLDAFY